MKDYSELTDINTKLIWNFRNISHTMRQTYEGKGSQQRILIILGENGGMPQSRLTQLLGIQPGSASEVISKLESAGLIERTLSESDKRTADIRLTRAGQVEAEQAAIRRRERHTRMFESFTDAEKAALLLMLERLNADWDVKFRGDSARGEPCRHGCRRDRRDHD